MTDWPVKTLGEVVRFDSETARPEDLSSTDVYVGLENIAGDGTLVGLGGVSAETLKSNKSRFTGDHILFGKLRPYLVKVVRPDFDGVCSTDILPLKPTGELTRDYLYWYMRSSAVIEAATEASTGTTLPRVSPTTLKSFEIPVPPLEEQKRIVALLDAATSSITELTSCYEQARTQANNLFTSALRDELEGNPDWPVKTLGELFDTKVKSAESLKQKDYLSVGRFPVVDQGQELVGGFTNNANLVRDFGKPVVVFGDHTRCVKYVDFPFASGADGTKILIPRQGADAKFAYFQLLSITLPSKGYARHFGELSKKSFILPPLEEQKRIVARLDEMRAKTSEMVAAYDAKLTAAKNLRQSILESAFAGEL